MTSDGEGEDAMQQAATKATNGNRESRPSGVPGDARALRILAKSVFRELKTTGYTRSDIVAFATNGVMIARFAGIDVAPGFGAGDGRDFFRRRFDIVIE